jgi:hypothetical protein
MSTILNDLQVSANWIANALNTAGYKADFSANSLVEIDRFFSEHSRNGGPVPGGLLAESLGQRLFSLGAYVGEVIRRSIGGEWRGNDSDPQAEIHVELHLPDGAVCWPVQRVMKRLQLGSEESIAAYGLASGLQLTVSMWQAPKPRWKLW